MIALADVIIGNGVFSNLFASAEEKRSKRVENANFNRNRCETNRMLEKEVKHLDLRKHDRQEIIYRHCFTG